VHQRCNEIATGPDFGVALFTKPVGPPLGHRPPVLPKLSGETPALDPPSAPYIRAIEAMKDALAIGDIIAAQRACAAAPTALTAEDPEFAISQECLAWMFMTEVTTITNLVLSEETFDRLDRLQAELIAAFPRADQTPAIAHAASALTTIVLASTPNDAHVRRNAFIQGAHPDFLAANPFLHVMALMSIAAAGYGDLARTLRDADLGSYESIWPEPNHPLRDRLAQIGLSATWPREPRALAAPPGPPVLTAQEQLDALSGLADVKHHISTLAKNLRTQQRRAQRGLTPMDLGGHHLVFTGNPGTGKTTVARLIGQLYCELGLLERGHVVELGRAGLVAPYIGQTEERTHKALNEALGGVLFIDEAYALNPGDSARDFGARAIDEIVQFASAHAGELVIILAGYPEEMEQLLDVNPGLRSRFSRRFAFGDYTTKELLEVIEIEAGNQDYSLAPEARAALEQTLDALPRDRNFGNAREALAVFRRAVEAHGARVDDLENPMDESLMTILAEDIPTAHELAPGLAQNPQPEAHQAHGIYI
jgi:Cdc6-like AAA superfamily ATPase